MTFVSCQCESAQTPAEKLLELINRGIENDLILFGHQDDPVYGHTWKYEPNRSDVLETAGDYPAIMGWDLGAIELDSLQNLDGVPFETMRQEIKKQHERGGINTFSWHAYTIDGKDSWTDDVDVVSTLLPGGANYDAFQIYLQRAANFLLSLRDEQGELIPIIFRPWHEHDGNWFWWGEKRCSHAEYVALWNMTYEFMTAQKLNNLVWAYMPAEGLDDKTPDVSQFDIVGIDTYQSGDDSAGYIEKMEAKLAFLKKEGEKYNKPIAVTETGCEGVQNEDWWTKVLYPVIKDQPISYVLMWRNAWDKPGHFYGPFPEHSEADDFVEFANKPDIILAKELKEFAQ